MIDEKPVFTSAFEADLLNGTEIIRTTGYLKVTNVDGSVAAGESAGLTLIPYHLWNNRGKGEMRVWLPYADGEV
jgi:hypothetical protein